MTDRICAAEGCGRPQHTRDWCRDHYYRWLKHGDPLAGRTPKGEPIRFLRSVVDGDTEDCVLWPYNKFSDGYGCIDYEGKRCRVPRLALILATGVNPRHLVARHGPCNNRLCFNPRHLSWGTRPENSADMIRDDTSTRGERNPHAKLTERDVIEIRRLLAEGCTGRSIAVKFSVREMCISNIRRGVTWGWLT